MKKCLFILVFLLSFFLTITYCYASEEDILKEPVKEEEEEDIKEEDNLLKGTGGINNTKAYVSDPLQATQIQFYMRYNSSNSYLGVYVGDIPIGTEYYIYLTYRVNSTNSVGGYVSIDTSSYNKYKFIRGYEDNSLNYYVKVDDNYFSGTLSYTNQTITSNNCYYELVNQPTPEPTPDPTPDPTPLPTPIVSDDNINTVSWNSVSENLISIEQQIIDLRKDFNTFRNMYVSNNAVVSNNIIKKRLSDYTVSESIGLITLLMGFCAGLVYLIHKSIFKWR